MELLHDWKFAAYILGIIGMGAKQYIDMKSLTERMFRDIETMTKRMQETEDKLKDYSVMQADIKSISEKVRDHDILLNKMSVDLGRISENILSIKGSIELLNKKL